MKLISSNSAISNKNLYDLLKVTNFALSFLAVVLIGLIIFVVKQPGKQELIANETAVHNVLGTTSTPSAAAAVTATPSTSLVPSYTPTPSPTPDPMASWKTYKNIKYNYSFKYPSDWGTVDSGPSANPDNVYIGTLKDSEFLASSPTAANFIGTARIKISSTVQPPVKNTAMDVKYEPIIVNGKQGSLYIQTLLVDIPGYGSKGKIIKKIIIQENNAFYTFEFYDQSQFSILDSILKTYQFHF